MVHRVRQLEVVVPERPQDTHALCTSSDRYAAASHLSESGDDKVFLSLARRLAARLKEAVLAQAADRRAVVNGFGHWGNRSFSNLGHICDP